MSKFIGKIRTSMVRRLSAVLLSAAAMSAVLVPAQQTYAADTCKVIHVSGALVTAIRPHMDVPICYNGLQVWQQSGNITPGVDTYGYGLDDISWYGTYGGGSWLSVGENYTVTAWGGWATFSCASRWGVNASGDVISFDRGC